MPLLPVYKRLGELRRSGLSKHIQGFSEAVHRPHRGRYQGWHVQRHTSFLIYMYNKAATRSMVRIIDIESNVHNYQTWTPCMPPYPDFVSAGRPAPRRNSSAEESDEEQVTRLAQTAVENRWSQGFFLVGEGASAQAVNDLLHTAVYCFRVSTHLAMHFCLAVRL